MSTTAPKREPIPVGVIQFHGNGVTLPGKPMASSLTHRAHKTAAKTVKHEIAYLPWLRCFRITFESNNGPMALHVMEGRVESWTELEPAAEPEPATEKKPKAK
jgi:hypothetical protein